MTEGVREVVQDFEARPYQRRFMGYLDHHGRGGRAVWVVHRRGGKDLTALHQTVKMMLQRRGAYWHVFPTAEQGRKAIWEGFTKDGKRIMESVFPREIRRSPREFLPKSEMVVELLNGSIWRLVGSDLTEVVGAGPVGVVFSEYAVAKPTAWNLIRPMLRENEGWAAFITTPRGNNHAKELFDTAGREPGWFRELLTLYDTRAYDPDKTIAEERAEGMPEALIRQEYLCDWTAALVGSVWGELMEELDRTGRLEAFEHPDDGVFTSWDLGVSDSTAIWFWRLRDDGVEFVDHFEAHGRPLSHYAAVCREKGYRYLKHWFPHDARARTYLTGRSIFEHAQEELGIPNVAVVPGKLSLVDGVQAGRRLLQQADTRFHSRCAEGIEALKAYHYSYDEDRRTFSDKPAHDWSSHTADAFRYAAVVVELAELLKPKPAPTPEPIELKLPTAADLFTARRRAPTGPKRVA